MLTLRVEEPFVKGPGPYSGRILAVDTKIEPLPGPRYVILGASNVRLGLPEVIGLLVGRTSQRSDILLAAGHGRSYGRESRFLGWRSPAILSTGLWPALESPGRAGSIACRALIADVGNDLLYGASAAETARWVADALRRLPANSEAVILLPPCERLTRLPTALLGVARRVFYPGRRDSIRSLLAAAGELDERLRELVASGSGQLARLEAMTPSDDWYSVDPIHFARRRRRQVFSSAFDRWTKDDGRDAERRLSRAERAALRRAWSARAPESRWASLADGSRVWLF